MMRTSPGEQRILRTKTDVDVVWMVPRLNIQILYSATVHRLATSRNYNKTITVTLDFFYLFILY